MLGSFVLFHNLYKWDVLLLGKNRDNVDGYWTFLSLGENSKIQLFICGGFSINRHRVTTVAIELVVQLCPVWFLYHACLIFLHSNWSWGFTVAYEPLLLLSTESLPFSSSDRWNNTSPCFTHVSTFVLKAKGLNLVLWGNSKRVKWDRVRKKRTGLRIRKHKIRCSRGYS